MTLSLLDAGCGPSSPSQGPDWLKLVGALLVAAALLVAGPLRCTAPIAIPQRAVPEDHFATDATTWSHSTTEGIAG